MSTKASPSNRDIGHLRAFVAVAETLSFSRAAEQLGMKASALSQSLRAFEESLGIRLVNRTTRSVSLTEAGERLLERSAPALAALGEALVDVKGRSATPFGPVRIHCFRVAVDLFITPMLAAFHARHPGVVLDLTIDDHVVDLVAEGFDAAIRIGEVIERDMVARKLSDELRHVAVASPDYLARHGTPQHPNELRAHACIGWRWPGHELPYRWEFVHEGKGFEVVVGGPLIANSRDFCVRAAVEGIGIAFAIEEAVAPHIASGRLVPLLQKWTAGFPGFYLCYPSQRQMAPALRAFVDSVCAGSR